MSYLRYLCFLVYSVVQHVLLIWVTWRVSCGRQELLAPLGRLGSPPVFSGVRVAHLFSFLCCVFCFCLSSSCVLSTQCCQFLWIFHIWLHFRFSLTFICNIDCLLYVPSIYRRRPSWILCWNMGRVVTAEVTMVTDKVCRAGQERAILSFCTTMLLP